MRFKVKLIGDCGLPHYFDNCHINDLKIKPSGSVPFTSALVTLKDRLYRNWDLTRIITLRPMTHRELNFEIGVMVSICSPDRTINSHIVLYSIISSTYTEKSLKF